MNFIGLHKLYGIQPLAHIEGKLKSYESCEDIRAWSHDLRQRDRYLREWIKSDMPLCVVPISTLIGFFRAMTCTRGGRTAPRCHPNCKSKTVLESITASCEAIRECLKEDRNLDKFFCEEEFETSHWPCDRYLEALKSIKMFWRILLEKMFAINLKKNECFEDKNCNCNNVRNVARHWEKDMVQQAVFVKKLTPQLNENGDNCSSKSCLKKSNSYNMIPQRHCCGGDKNSLPCTNVISSETKPSYKKKVTLNCCTPREKQCNIPPKRTCRCISVKVRTADACCGSTSDIAKCKENIRNFQKDYQSQQEEIERLKQENAALKCELKNRACQWNSPLLCASALFPKKNNTSILPEPFDRLFIKDDDKSTKSAPKVADSELFITMKNCKDEDFKQVSLLQVLHKTNNPRAQENDTNEPCYQNEDPLNVLKKVQATLSAMVRKEMIVARKRQKSANNSEIEASFQRLVGQNVSDSEMSV